MAKTERIALWALVVVLLVVAYAGWTKQPAWGYLHTGCQEFMAPVGNPNDGETWVSGITICLNDDGTVDHAWG